jgi:hypothetical protein
MYSDVLPLEELKRRSVMYGLPARGMDNGGWADTWVILAELEAGHVTAVLDLLPVFTAVRTVPFGCDGWTLTYGARRAQRRHPSALRPSTPCTRGRRGAHNFRPR